MYPNALGPRHVPSGALHERLLFTSLQGIMGNCTIAVANADASLEWLGSANARILDAAHEEPLRD